MPAPAVIPALIAYVKVVAVKTLVVGIRWSDVLGCALGSCVLTGAPGKWP